MPLLSNSLEALRVHRHLSQEQAVHGLDLSASHLSKIERRERNPSLKVVNDLAHAYYADPNQLRHLHDLWKPSTALRHPDEIRNHPTAPDARTHLDHLAERGILALCFDPLATVLYGNRLLHQAAPGLEDTDHNLVLWLFTPAARHIVLDWDTEARHALALLRGTLARYRDCPRARRLFRALCACPDFVRLWNATTTHIAYARDSPTPIHLHTPGTDHPRPLSLEISEYGECPDILIGYGVYDLPATR